MATKKQRELIKTMAHGIESWWEVYGEGLDTDENLSDDYKAAMTSLHVMSKIYLEVVEDLEIAETKLRDS
jgi:hypothetical protein